MKNIFCLLVALLISQNLLAQTPFITTWKTDNLGAGTPNRTSITIPTTGTGYNYDVDWNNDGTFEQTGVTGNVTHNYGTAGTYTVAIRGAFPRIYFNNNGVTVDRVKILSVDQWGSIAWTSMENAFYGCSFIVFNATDVPNTAAVTNMSFMFAGCRHFNQALPSGFTTANVTNMNSMFSGCDGYNQALPSGFTTTNVTNMSSMFSDCRIFNQALPSGFTTANVTNMSSMFSGCGSFNQTLPSGFTTANVTDMSSIFSGCSFFEQALPSGFTTANATNMSSMFSGCRYFNQNIGNFNITNATNMTDIFQNSGISISNYDAILTAWNTAGYTNKNLGDASPLKYCAGQAARTALTTAVASGGKGWTITGDAYQSNVAAPTGTSNSTICSGANRSLSATCTSGSVVWYGSNSTTLLATGSPYLTPNLTTNTTYQVRCEDGTPPAATCNSNFVAVNVSINALPTITLGTITPITSGATTFTIPYTASTGSPTAYSISGTGITSVTDAALPSSPITVNLSVAASVGIVFTLTVKNAGSCSSANVTGAVVINTLINQICATATFTGIAPIVPTATTAGVGGRGGIHTYTVPAGVTSIRLDARGAKGGTSPISGGGTFVGGTGGRVQATYSVMPGDVLHILVGGKGGNGSPDNGINQRTTSGGGGATVVSKGPIGTGTLLLVAGGGGGAGHSGGGGVSNNVPGSGNGVIGGGGASFSAAGGNSIIGDNCGQGGQALNTGGNGGANSCFKPETNGGGYGGGGAGNYSPNNAGGGGGGGYIGGNAGGVAGGNGGSSFTDASASNVTTNNHSDDNGSVTISVAGTISYIGSPFCKSLITTTAPTTTGYTGGTFSSTAGLTIDANTGVVNPSTSTAGTYTVSYNVAGVSSCPAIVTTSVRIEALPNARANNTGPYLFGNTISLSASGGGSYVWSGPNSFTSSLQSPSISNALLANAGIYTVTVTSGNCSATATTNVVINNIDPCSASRIVDYYYVKAGNPYQTLFPMTNGMVIQQIPEQVSILVTPICPSVIIESFEMNIQGPEQNWNILQNISPNALFDNFGLNVYGRNFIPGTYTLTVTGYALDNLGGGITYGPVITTFTVVGTMATISAPTLSTQNLCAGSSVGVTFSTSGNFDAVNQFQIQLSDVNGGFENPVIIGTKTTAGTLTCGIPQSTVAGANYLIRVASNNQVLVSNPVINTLIINPLTLNLASPTNDLTGTQSKQAGRTINASNKVISPASVTYQAGNAILLTPGFESGAVFKAEIRGCGN